MYASRPASCSGSSTSPPPVRKTTALNLPSFLPLVKTPASSVATVLKRPDSGPLSPIFSMAAMPASTVGGSSPAEAWNTRTLTSDPPGGEGRDNVVAILSFSPGSGYGLAVAARPPSRDAVRAPAATAAATPRRDLDLRCGVRCMWSPTPLGHFSGHYFVTAPLWSLRQRTKLDLFS